MTYYELKMEIARLTKQNADLKVINCTIENENEDLKHTISFIEDINLFLMDSILDYNTSITLKNLIFKSQAEQIESLNEEITNLEEIIGELMEQIKELEDNEESNESLTRELKRLRMDCFVSEIREETLTINLDNEKKLKEINLNQTIDQIKRYINKSNYPISSLNEVNIILNLLVNFGYIKEWIIRDNFLQEFCGSDCGNTVDEQLNLYLNDGNIVIIEKEKRGEY